MLIATTPELTGKTLIGYGASVAAVTTMASTGLRPALFVDGNDQLHGDELAGVTIAPPAAIADWLQTHDAAELFVLVFAYATRAVASIFTELTALGLEHGRHFGDCSLWHYEPMAAQLARLGIDADSELFRQVRVLAIYSTLDNRSSIAGSWLLQQLLRHQLARVPGDVAEAGVYRGGSAFLSLALAHDRLAGRDYHLLDSFEGLIDTSAHDPASRSGELADAPVAEVRERFSHFPRAHLHVGSFAQRFGNLANRQFCFVYVDCDLYEPARQCGDFFYPRLPPGGMMLFHDYWVDIDGLALPPHAPEPFTGIRLAVDELATTYGLDVVRFPETTHALIVKPD